MSTVLRLGQTAALILGFAVMAGTTAARPGLPNETSIVEGLIATAIAYEIGRRCDSLEPRMMRGLNYLYALRAEARNLGYSEEEIDAFVDSKEQQDRVEAMAWVRFGDLGGVKDDYATYCAVGREQIAQNTPIGQLLR